jgi:hypothetical protein
MNGFINVKLYYTKRSFSEMACLFINGMLLKGNALAVPISKDL